MRARNSTRSLLLIVALVAVAVAACSSSSKSAGSTVTTTSPGSATVTTSPTPTTRAPKSFSGSSDSTFCNLVRKDQAVFNGNKSISTRTPPGLKALYSKLVPALEQAAAIAPSEIKTDFATYVSSVKQINAAFAGAQYNLENLDPATLQKLDTPQIEDAFANINDYSKQVCHTATPTTAASPAP